MVMSDATDSLGVPLKPPASTDVPVIYGWDSGGKVEFIGPLHSPEFEPIQIRPKPDKEKKRSKWLDKKIKYRT